MKQYTHRYTSDEEFKKWLDSCGATEGQPVLVQILCDAIDKHHLYNLVHKISDVLPNAIIIRRTSKSEQPDEKPLGNCTMISLSLFDQKNLKNIQLIGSNHEVSDNNASTNTSTINNFSDDEPIIEKYYIHGKEISQTKKLKKSLDLSRAEFSYTSLNPGELMNLIEAIIQEYHLYTKELIETNKFLKLKDDALNVSAHAIIITDVHGKIQWVNRAYTRLTGYSLEEAVGQDSKDLVNSGLHEKSFYESLWNTILSNKVWHGEIMNRRKSGALYNEEMTITPMTNNEGEIEHFVAIKQDITERKEVEELIHKYAFYDTLTKLPNRRLLEDRLSLAKATSKRTGKYAALLFMDLDNFKPLNDTHGHTIGDLLLKEVAHRLTTCVRETDTVARFGGDEFVVLLTELSEDKNESLELAMAIGEKIRVTLAHPYFLKATSEDGEDTIIEHHCTSSIGADLFINSHRSNDDIIKSADLAMYDAKEAGRNQVKLNGQTTADQRV